MRMNPPRGMAMGPQVLNRPDALVTEAYLAVHHREWDKKQMHSRQLLMF